MLFLCVKNPDDYLIYFALTCAITVVNGIVNCYYAKEFVSLDLKNLQLKKHLKAISTIGLYMILSSMYTTFNVAYLGIVTNNQSVGYYTTSLKLYSIILGVFTALNAVLVPRLSSLIANDNSHAFSELINKSILFVATFCFPVIMCGMVLAPQIINILTGGGYDGAIICFRIIMPLIFIVGLAQILSNQILMSLKKDRELAITSFVGAAIGISLNIWLVPLYREVGTSCVVLISEICVTSLLYFFCVKHAKVTLPIKSMLQNFIMSIPYLLICYVFTAVLSNNILILMLSGLSALVYFVLSQCFIIKNTLILDQLNNVTQRLGFNKTTH